MFSPQVSPSGRGPLRKIQQFKVRPCVALLLWSSLQPGPPCGPYCVSLISPCLVSTGTVSGLLCRPQSPCPVTPRGELASTVTENTEATGVLNLLSPKPQTYSLPYSPSFPPLMMEDISRLLFQVNPQPALDPIWPCLSGPLSIGCLIFLL